jgi:hypothetical protein
MTSWERVRWWLRYHRRQAALAVLGATVVLGSLVALIAVSLEGSNSSKVAVPPAAPVVIPDPVTAPATVPPTTATPQEASPTTIAKPKTVPAPKAKPAPKPVVAPRPKPAAAPKPVAAPKPAPAPKPVPAPKPAPAPVPAPTPAPAPKPAPAPVPAPAPKPATVPLLTINVVVYSASQAPFNTGNPGADCTQVALQRAAFLTPGVKVYGPAGQLLGTAYFTKGHYVDLRAIGDGSYSGDCELTAVLPNFLAESVYTVHVAEGTPTGDPAFTSAALAAAKWQSTFKLDYGNDQLTVVSPQPSQ